MNQPKKTRGTVYFDPAQGLWIAEAQDGLKSNGRPNRIRRKAKTKNLAQTRLDAALAERDLGLSLDNPPMHQVIHTWLAHVEANREPGTYATKVHLCKRLTKLDKIRVKDLTVLDVERLLYSLRNELSRRTLRDLRGTLAMCLDWCMRRDLVGRNVARLAEVPRGKPGRPSKALNPEQAAEILTNPGIAKHWLFPYLVVSLLTGARTEEIRALTWEDVDLEADPPRIYVRRSVRSTGDVKTRKSKRAIALPWRATAALRQQARWQIDHLGCQPKLVFTTRLGTPLDPSHVRRDMRKALAHCHTINPKEWTPRELRHSFASLLSNEGVSIDIIAQLLGHSTTATTERVYRKQLKEIVIQGTEILDRLTAKQVAPSAQTQPNNPPEHPRKDGDTQKEGMGDHKNTV